MTEKQPENDRLKVFVCQIAMVLLCAIMYVVDADRDAARAELKRRPVVYDVVWSETPMCSCADREPWLTCPLESDGDRVYSRLEFLARVITALDRLGVSVETVVDYVDRGLIESRHNPRKISLTGDHGAPQINAVAHPEIDMDRLLIDPDYVAESWLPLYQSAVKAQGRKNWECAYNRGAAGCRAFVSGQKRKVKK